MTRLRRIAAGVAVAISLVLCASPMQTAWGQELRAFDADIRDLERKRADILRKLEHLIARLPTETSKSKSFKHRKAYAERILELRKALRRLDGERRELLEEVANVPRIPPLKLVEVVGPKDKQSNNFSTYGGPEIWQIAYKRGSNGYTAKIIKSVRDTYWTVSFAVTSAPLEIIPGRPFDIEGQVKIRFQYSTSPRARPCAESPSIKVGLRIRHFSDDVWRYAPTELKCSGNATLDLRLRFTPVRQKWIRGADRWETSYRSSVSGGGVISEEADGKGKRQAFEIRSFRYPPFRHDRGVEPYDFSFQIEPLFYYLPPIKFFYPPLRPGERAVTSLGNYRHPRLLDRPPDVANIEVPDVRSFKVDGAKRRLQILGLKTKTKSAGRPARRMDADRVTRQDPKPGTKVKTGTTVTLSHYTAYVPTRSELVRDMQRQCDRVKGAIAYWESRLNSPRCRCAKGMQLNRAKTACVKIRATTTSRRSTESGRSSGQRRSEPAWSCTDVLGEIRRRAGSGDRAGAARLADDPRTRAACPRGARSIRR